MPPKSPAHKMTTNMAAVAFSLVLYLSIFMSGERRTSASVSEKKEYLSRLASLHASLGWQRSAQVNSTAVAAMLMDHINRNCGPRHQKILYEFRLQEFSPSTGHFSAVASTGGSLHSNQVETHLFRGVADFHQMTVVNVSRAILPREQVWRASTSTTEPYPTRCDKGMGFNNGSQGEPATYFIVYSLIDFFLS